MSIPEKIADLNLIIEAVVPGGIRKTLTYFANSLLLSVQSSVGQLQVLERPANQGMYSLIYCVCFPCCFGFEIAVNKNTALYRGVVFWSI